MSSIEKKQKQRRFDIDISDRSAKHARKIESVSEADTPKEKELNRQVIAVVNYWKSLDLDYSDAFKMIGNSRKRAVAVRTLKDADKIMKVLAPLLRTFSDVPNVSLYHEKDAWEVIKITDLLAAGGLVWVASFAEGWKSEAGRRSETFAIRCAEDLAEVLKRLPDNRSGLKGSPNGIRRFCEDGFTGEKSRIGTLRVGDEIELIDSRECGDIMSRVRVIKGKLSGELDCMASDALSTVKP